MTEPREVIDAYIRKCLARQYCGEQLSEADHRWLIRYVDMGILGMDGFKYCWPAEAKESFRKMQEARACQKTA